MKKHTKIATKRLVRKSAAKPAAKNLTTNERAKLVTTHVRKKITTITGPRNTIVVQPSSSARPPIVWGFQIFNGIGKLTAFSRKYSDKRSATNAAHVVARRVYKVVEQNYDE